MLFPSFFSLAPAYPPPDPAPPTLAERAEQEAFVAAYSQLVDVLQAAIDAYCMQYPETTMDVVYEALSCHLWSMEQVMAEDAADA